MDNLLLRKWDISRTYTVLLVIFDIAAINVSSAVALMLRFSGPLETVPGFFRSPVADNIILNTILTLAIFVILRLYSSVWRFASIHELYLIVVAVALSSMENFIVYGLQRIPMFRSYYILYGLSLLILTVGSRFAYRFLRFAYRAGKRTENTKNVMIVGGGQACDLVLRELTINPTISGKVKCIIDDDVKKHGTYIRGHKIIGGREQIKGAVEKYDIDTIIVAMPSVPRGQIRDLLDLCAGTGCELKILPGVYQFITGDVEVAKLRSVNIADLLGREEVDVRDAAVGASVRGKRILVTGGGGSIGSELCRQIAANGPAELVLLDVYENTTYEVERELREQFPQLPLEVLIGSVRDEGRLREIFEEYRPESVYHAAAHKHVPLMEGSPAEAIKNNVFGTYNLCKLADEFGVHKFVLISTDKAVNPTNIMGASKRLCEMVVQFFAGHSETTFAAVRFGNVLGSHGSVIPIFQKQIAEGGPVTVTDPNIIRYFMTIPEAVSLVLKAGASAKGGEIFVLDMGEPVKIDDLAKNLIRLAGYQPGVDIQIEYTGLRPGEKLYEELLMAEEGLAKTDNELIYVGKPIDFDEQSFEAALLHLKEVAYEEDETVIREEVKKLVTTYRPAEGKSES